MTSIRFHDGQTVTALSLSALAELNPSSLSDSQMVWVDLANPSPEETSQVLGTWFPVHELVQSDLRRAHQSSDDERLHHPKVEEYDGYLFVIVHALTQESNNTDAESFRSAQLGIVISERVIITYHADTIAAVDSVLRSCDTSSRILRHGPDYLLHLLLDDIVDTFLPVLSAFEDELDLIEEAMFANGTTIPLRHILQIKRRLQVLRRNVVYMREIVNRLARGEFELVSLDESVYYRNVYDHLVRVVDQLEASRDLVMSIMEAYFSVTSNRLNQVMKVLTVFSTIFLPLTFISSVYGMNFEFMPELHWKYGYLYAWIVIIATGTIMFFVFRRKGWLR